MAMKSERLLTQTELAYIAGFFDGEGCVSFFNVKKGIYGLVVQISQVDPRPLQYVAERFGGKIVCRQQKRKNRRPLFQWRIYSSNAQFFLEQINDFLINKKDQAQIALQMRKTRLGSGRGKLPSNVVDIREQLDSDIRKLKVMAYIQNIPKC